MRLCFFIFPVDMNNDIVIMNSKLITMSTFDVIPITSEPAIMVLSIKSCAMVIS